MTLGSNWGSAPIFVSNSSHAFMGNRCKQGSNGEGVSTARTSPVDASTSRNRDGRLVRPFASIACSKCPRNMFPRSWLTLRGLMRHYLPLYPTNSGPPYGGKLGGVNSLRALRPIFSIVATTELFRQMRDRQAGDAICSKDFRRRLVTQVTRARANHLERTVSTPAAAGDHHRRPGRAFSAGAQGTASKAPT